MFGTAGRLGRGTVFCYGVGHWLNDMTSGLWFSFLLVFLEQVAGLSPSNAGLVMLAGQVADAISTPLAGRASDATSRRFYRRKLWLGLGAVLVNASFFFVFSNCWPCSSARWLPPTAWFAFWAATFNVGWATLQVAHMSLITDLSRLDGERTRLNSARYAGCIIATLSELCVTTLAFRFLGINYRSFRITAITALGVGDLFTLVFMLGVTEPRFDPPAPTEHSEQSILTAKESSSSTASLGEIDVLTKSRESKEFRWFSWFGFAALYQIAVVYMCSRAAANLSSVFMPFYLQQQLDLTNNPDVLAEVPAVLMLCSFVTSFFMRAVNKKLGRLAALGLGSALMAMAGVTLFFLRPKVWWAVFGVAVLLGLGTTLMLVTSISMQADLVGSHTSSGALVYGLISFADKLLNGVLIVVITTRVQTTSLGVLIVMSAVPTGCSLIALLGAASVPAYWWQLRAKLCHHRKSTSIDDETRGLLNVEQQSIQQPATVTPSTTTASHHPLLTRGLSGTIPDLDEAD